MLQKYGICTCHNKHNPINSKGLCPEGARQRHKYSASMKNMVVKKKSNKKEIEKEDGTNSTRGRTQELRGIQEIGELDREQQGQLSTKKSFDFKKANIKPRSEKNKKLVTQELLMFKQIWEERPHFCEVTGKPLGAFDVRLFSHVLTKGAYPKFRLYKKNIVLCLYEKHHEWEFKTRKTLELSWIETLESALKTEYYKK